MVIDADIFLSDGGPIGPLVPYLPLVRDHEARVLLLPHATADTDHPSRVAGARQAVDQIIAAIRYRCVVNGIGPVPEGYTALSSQSVLGVGRVSAKTIDVLSEDTETIKLLRAQLADVDHWLERLPANRGGAADDRGSQEALLALNRLSNRVRELGLLGPGTEL